VSRYSSRGGFSLYFVLAPNLSRREIADRYRDKAAA
jgi:hypothetical protein